MALVEQVRQGSMTAADDSRQWQHKQTQGGGGIDVLVVDGQWQPMSIC